MAWSGRECHPQPCLARSRQFQKRFSYGRDIEDVNGNEMEEAVLKNMIR
jgi:hypothetical protein